jgi:hypothetical protein
LSGVGHSISVTHSIVDKHANNCDNTSACASTNTVKNASASSAVFEQNNNDIHSARATKAGAAKTIAEARRRSAALHAAAAPALPALPSPQGGQHTRTSAMATATTMTMKMGTKTATGTKMKIATMSMTR